jgi:glycosyltransferase involved in cell wall biosynthesis
MNSWFSSEISQVYLSFFKGVNYKKEDILSLYGVKYDFRLLGLAPIFSFGKTYLLALMDLVRILVIKPDYIYGRSIFTAYFLSFTNYKFSFECHSSKWQSDGNLAKMYKRVFTSSNLEGLVLITQKLKDELLLDFPDFNNYKIVVLPDAANDLNLDYKGKTEAKSVGYLGSFYKGRGIELIVELAERIPHLNFYLAGGTEKDLMSLGIDASNLRNLKCIGFIAHSETSKFISEMDILLAPYMPGTRTVGGSDSTSYMSPIKIFEFLASKRPMICSDLPVLREVLNDYNAILVNPTDTEKWVIALTDLTVNYDKRFRIAQNAYNDFKNNYTWEKRAHSVLNFIKKTRV